MGVLGEPGPSGNSPATVRVEHENHGFEAVKDITFGSIAGIVGKVVEYPFDTVKVRLQSQPEGQALRYKGPLDCLKQSIHQDGVRGLYRGISAPLVGAAAETSSLFFSYRIIKDFLQSTLYTSSSSLPLGVLMASGAASGAFTSLVLTPIELVKCQMQVPSGAPHLRGGPVGPITIISSIYSHHGLLGFWHGQLGTFIRETGGSATWFGSYEAISLLFRARSSSNSAQLPIYQQLVAGAVAGMSYNFIFFPADTIKSRMQTETVGPLGAGRRTFGSVGKAVWQQQGLRGLYQGCGITVLRSAPSSALIFAIYESLKDRFG